MSLNPAQTEAIAHGGGPCLILAGPGSGKTTVITRRIEYLVNERKISPASILVVTFSRAAANEMRERFLMLGQKNAGEVTFGTFHGIYYGILKRTYGLKPDVILSEEEKRNILRRISADMKKTLCEDEPLGCAPGYADMPHLGNQSREEDAFFKDSVEESEWLDSLAGEISLIKNSMIPPDGIRPKSCDKEKFRQIAAAYEQEKAKLGKMDFDDMLVYTLRLFKKRPDVLAAWQEKYSYILIDEFQDINQVQYDVIRLLAAPRNNIFAVGDDDQSIYGFRGARPKLMRDFLKDYKGAKQILLNVNYRSTKSILKAAECVIKHNSNRFPKQITTTNKSGSDVCVMESEDPVSESRYVAGEILKASREGCPLHNIGILFRTNTEAGTMAETLTEYGIPFRMREHIPNPYEHFVGKDLTAYMRMANGEYSRELFLRIMNRPCRYIERAAIMKEEVSFKELEAFYKEKPRICRMVMKMEQDIRFMSSCAPYAAIRYVMHSVRYDGFLKEYAEKRRISYEGLINVAEKISENAKAFRTIEEWLSHIKIYKETVENGKENPVTVKEAVNLTTMHASKGLEYDMVFITGANEGITPYKKAQGLEEMEEERRMFYVAMTRAKKRLIITYGKERCGKKNEPSRFLREINELL